MSEKQNKSEVTLQGEMLLMSRSTLQLFINSELAFAEVDAKLRNAEKRIAELEKELSYLWMCDHCKAAFSEPYPHTDSSCPVCRAIMRFTGPRY